MRRYPLEIALSLTAAVLIGLWGCFLLGLSADGHEAGLGPRAVVLDVMRGLSAHAADHAQMAAPVDALNPTAGLRG